MSSYKMRSSSSWHCPLCGNPKDAKADTCAACYNQIRNRETPQPEMIRRVLDLFDWNYRATGRYFRVADNTVRKWCKKYDIKRSDSRE